MKQIKGIDQKIAHWDDNFLQDELPTFKKMFCNSLGMMKANSGEEAILIYELGGKIKNHYSSDIDLENAEFSLLYRCVNANPSNLYAYFHAQLLKKLLPDENK